MTFGTGCLKITPGHDFNDYEIGKKYSLHEVDGQVKTSNDASDFEPINIFNEDAWSNKNVPEPFSNLDRFKVRKVVLTSSVAAVAYGHKEQKVFDENDWSNTGPGITPYAKSKTLAEKAAWDYVNTLSDDEKFDFTVINPVAVTGPMLTSDIGTSNDLLVKLAGGSIPACPRTVSYTHLTLPTILLV